MRLDQFEITPADVFGSRILRHGSGNLLAHYDEKDDLFTTTVSTALYQAIPKVDVHLDAMPDADDTFWWAENIEMGKSNKIEKAWVIEGDGIGTIYFLVNAETGMIKVGFTTNLTNRLSNYRSHNAGDFEVWRMPGNRKLERLILKRCKPIRFRGEWHYPHPALVKYILGADPYYGDEE